MLLWVWVTHVNPNVILNDPFRKLSHAMLVTSCEELSTAKRVAVKLAMVSFQIELTKNTEPTRIKKPSIINNVATAKTLKDKQIKGAYKINKSIMHKNMEGPRWERAPT